MIVPRSSCGLVLLFAACAQTGGDGARDPSDDPDDWPVETGIEWRPVLSAPRFVVPDAVDVLGSASNNNVAIELFDGRLWMAWRTAETHWASENAQMFIASSDDDGASWRVEHRVALGADVREPQLFVLRGRLHFTFFEAGTNPFAFEPEHMWRTTRDDLGRWSELETWGEEGEVAWDAKVRGGRLLFSSYTGNHYGSGESALRLHLRESDDGVDFPFEDPARPDLYVGGASEAGFEIDEEGALWAVLRNEDGDASGFGSLLCRTPPGALSEWDCPVQSDPERYDSPKMLRHGDDLYLVARRDVGGPFDQADPSLTLTERRQQNAAAYWDRPKRTALYAIDRAERRVRHLLDLPSAGDTAFPSVRRLDAHRFLIANYTSPLSDPDRTWIAGQGAVDGTSIYLITLTFEPAD